jgi:hypothetical protein
LLDAYATLGVTDLGVRLPLRDADTAGAALRGLSERCSEHVDPQDRP